MSSLFEQLSRQYLQASYITRDLQNNRQVISTADTTTLNNPGNPIDLTATLIFQNTSPTQIRQDLIKEYEKETTPDYDTMDVVIPDPESINTEEEQAIQEFENSIDRAKADLNATLEPRTENQQLESINIPQDYTTPILEPFVEDNSADESNDANMDIEYSTTRYLIPKYKHSSLLQENDKQKLARRKIKHIQKKIRQLLPDCRLKKDRNGNYYYDHHGTKLSPQEFLKEAKKEKLLREQGLEQLLKQLEDSQHTVPYIEFSQYETLIKDPDAKRIKDKTILTLIYFNWAYDISNKDYKNAYANNIEDYIQQIGDMYEGREFTVGGKNQNINQAYFHSLPYYLSMSYQLSQTTEIIRKQAIDAFFQDNNEIQGETDVIQDPATAPKTEKGVYNSIYKKVLIANWDKYYLANGPSQEYTSLIVLNDNYNLESNTYYNYKDLGFDEDNYYSISWSDIKLPDEMPLWMITNILFNYIIAGGIITKPRYMQDMDDPDIQRVYFSLNKLVKKWLEREAIINSAPYESLAMSLLGWVSNTLLPADYDYAIPNMDRATLAPFQIK